MAQNYQFLIYAYSFSLNYEIINQMHPPFTIKIQQNYHIAVNIHTQQNTGIFL